jgi:Tfp pilus assembly protein PilV
MGKLTVQQPPRARDRSGRAREESGVTLIEVLVVSLLLAVVLVPIFNALDFAGNQAPTTIEFANAVSDATTGLQKMMTEIRQAYAINGTNGDAVTGQGSYIDFFAVVADQNLEIKYDCSQPYPATPSNPYANTYRRCLRVACTTSASATPCTLPSMSTGTLVIDRVLNSNGNVFTFYDRTGAPNPLGVWSVRANVQVPARGPLNYGLTHSITLDNETSIPNLQNGQ